MPQCLCLQIMLPHLAQAPDRLLCSWGLSGEKKLSGISSSHLLQAKQSSVMRGPPSKEELQVLGVRSKNTPECETECTKKGERELRGSEGNTVITCHVCYVHHGPLHFARQVECTGVSWRPLALQLSIFTGNPSNSPWDVVSLLILS